MNLAVRNVPGQIVALSEVAQSIATCNSDELVIGGGFSIANGPGMVLSSVPIDNPLISVIVPYKLLQNVLDRINHNISTKKRQKIELPHFIIENIARSPID